MIALYLLLQVIAYGPWWLAFVAIAFFTARYLGLGGAFLGQILVAVMISALDYQWVQEEMHMPGWDGVPDQDAAFFAGMLIRVVLVNTMLVGVNAIALRMRRRAKAASREARGIAA